MSDFEFFAPLSFFSKSDPSEPAGRDRRIGGVISTEKLDKQGEIVIQKGLDFTPFLKGGWFNDNHKREATDILGYPTGVTPFKKGDRLPDGTVAAGTGTWAEGYLLKTKKATEFWELGLDLQKSNDRRLGFSIEGSVQKREGRKGEVVAKALVKNVAITHCPVGEDTRLVTLAKSLVAVEKGMTAGTATPGVAIATQGAQTGGGAGRVVMPQSLESKQHSLLDDDDDDEDKPLTKAAAVEAIRARLGSDVDFAERVYDTLHNLKRQSLL